jgi:hypothetical protein
MSELAAMVYAGRARLGYDQSTDVIVRIPDVEDPHWMAVVVEVTEDLSKIGEVPVTLLDGGPYEGWFGTAVISRGRDDRLRLMGHEPLMPPVGA